MSNLYNDVNIPTPIFRILEKNMYQGAVVPTFASATELTLPPKIFWGQKKIKKMIEDGSFKVPVSSQIYAMEGSYRHLLFEHGLKDDPNYVVEQRLYHEIIVDETTYLISAQFDCYEISPMFLDDYKEMNSISWLMNLGIGKYKSSSPDMFSKYHFQQNLLFFMANSPDVMEIEQPISDQPRLISAKDKYPMKRIRLLPVLRDWTPLEKIKNPALPSSKYAPPVDVPIWNKEEILADIKDKIRNLVQYKDSLIDDIPECTKEERWEQDTVYPVKKIVPGKKPVTCQGTAKLKTKYDAEKWIEAKKQEFIAKKKPIPKFEIEIRKAIPKRCTSGYCALSQCGKCNWWKDNKDKYLA